MDPEPCAVLQGAPGFKQEWCDIPTKLGASTQRLKEANQGMASLNARIALVQQRLTETKRKTSAVKMQAPQAVVDLALAVQLAQGAPSTDTIQAALVALDKAQGLSDRIQALQKQEAAYNDMLTALAEQTEQTVGASAALLAAAQLPEPMQQ